MIMLISEVWSNSAQYPGNYVHTGWVNDHGQLWVWMQEEEAA